MVELAREGWRIAIVHGNGPQVGDELVRNEVARRVASRCPLGVLVAATAGWIGYMIQQSLENALARAHGCDARGGDGDHADAGGPDDPALSAPTKPIGHDPDATTRRGGCREAGRAVGRDGAGGMATGGRQPAAAGHRGAAGDPALVDRRCHRDRRGRRRAPVYDDPHAAGWRAWTRWWTRISSPRCWRASSEAEVLLILTDVDAVYAGWGTPRRARSAG